MPISIANVVKLVCLFLIFQTNGLAQSDSIKHNYSIEYHVLCGKIVKNYVDFPKYDISLLTGINLVKQTRGEKLWHSYYNFPRAGLMLLYGYNGNNRVFGKSISLIPNITFDYKYRKVNANITVGLGLAYFNKPYNRISNPENVVIGSKITNSTYAAITFNREITKKIDINAGLGILHFSNGHYKLPNVGMNVPFVNLGLIYAFKSKSTAKEFKKCTDYYKKWVANVRLSLGIHEFGYATKPTGGPKYPVYNAALYASKRLTYINTLQIGVMASYYTDYYDYIVDQQVYDSQEKLKSSCFTVFAGHEYLLGRLSFVTQFGINVYHPFQLFFYEQNNDLSGISNYLKVYNSNRLGVQYYLLNPLESKRFNINVGLFIKAKFFSADFVEGTLGFSF